MQIGSDVTKSHSPQAHVSETERIVMNPQKSSVKKRHKPIRIILADDHQIVRQGLRVLLESEADIEVIAEADSGRKLVKIAQELLPDIILMDLAMPELNGIEATCQILALVPKIKVIALSMHFDSFSVFNMVKAGASGYLLKDSAAGELIKAIRSVVTGKNYFSSDILGTVLQNINTDRPHTIHSAFSVLTSREREVLQLLAEGKTSKQIASSLYLSIKTIETHRAQIMNKLGIKSVAELTKYAIIQGLTSL
jgi:two-component system, NarL family, response regulator NreC